MRIDAIELDGFDRRTGKKAGRNQIAGTTAGAKVTIGFDPKSLVPLD